MLSLTPASRSLAPGHTPSIGLALAGGGPLGAIYELGALHALNDAIDGVCLHELDAYTGVSSGAFLAASLANQVTTTQMCRIFMGAPDAEFAFRPEDFLRPALREYFQRTKNLPRAMAEVVRELITHPSRIPDLSSLGGITRLIPAGVFDNRTIERFVRKVLSRPGRSNDFRRLTTMLRIVAVELDTGQAVRFGAPGMDHIPISQAVQASAALPGLYPPVTIEGRDYVDGALRRTLHASSILREGVDLLIGINPLVPYDSRMPDGGEATHVVSGGLPLVMSQTFRALIQSRMQIGIGKYASDYPGASLMLLEPNRNDERMFFTNVFSYAGRSGLAEHAYQTTRTELLTRADELEAFLEPYGLGVRRAELAAPKSLLGSLRQEPPHLAPLSNNLARSLDRLDRCLDRAG